MKADEIYIAGLGLRVRIGVTERERIKFQRLTVSLTLRAASNFRRVGDEIDHTINYSAVCAAVRASVRGGMPRKLIETLAQDIAATVLKQFPVCSEVDVELRKFIVPDTEYVAVRLTRRQSP